MYSYPDHTFLDPNELYGNLDDTLLSMPRTSSEVQGLSTRLGVHATRQQNKMCQPFFLVDDLFWSDNLVFDVKGMGKIKKVARMYRGTKKLRLLSPMLDAGNFVQKYVEERKDACLQ
jgi:hypothetical protein